MRTFAARQFLSVVMAGSIWVAFTAVSMADEMTMQATNPATAQATTNAPTAPVSPTPITPTANGASLYAFTVNSLDGKPVDLHQYMGHVALVLNTASKSGHADQFVGLQKLYDTYKDKGFVVLDFPSNDFGQLEPGTVQDVAARYATFQLTFPIFEISKVRGDGQSPVFHFLTTGHGMPTWNFHKYLVDKSGQVIKEFSSQTKPDNKDLLAAIDAALK